MAKLGAAADANTAGAGQPQRGRVPAATGCFTDLPAFSTSALPAIKSLGQASVTGKAAVQAAGPTVADLNQFAKPTPELAQNLAIVLHDLDDRRPRGRARLAQPRRQGLHGPGGAAPVRLQPDAGDQHVRAVRAPARRRRVRRTRCARRTRRRRRSRMNLKTVRAELPPVLRVAGPEPAGRQRDRSVEPAAPASPTRAARPRASRGSKDAPALHELTAPDVGRRERSRHGDVTAATGASSVDATSAATAVGGLAARGALPSGPPRRPSHRGRTRSAHSPAPQLPAGAMRPDGATPSSAFAQPGPDRRGHRARAAGRGVPGLQRQQRPAVRAHAGAQGRHRQRLRPRRSATTCARAASGSGSCRRMKPVELPNGQAGAQLTLQARTRPTARSRSTRRASIRPPSVLGLKYVDLHKGTSNQVFADGGDAARSRRRTCRSSSTTSSRRSTPRPGAPIQENLVGFGNTLAGRGSALNDTIASLPALLGHLEPVAAVPVRSEHRADARSFDSLNAFMGAVAPVAPDQRAAVHGHGDDVRRDLPRPERSGGDDRASRRRRSRSATESLKRPAAVPARPDHARQQPDARPPQQLEGRAAGAQPGDRGRARKTLARTPVAEREPQQVMHALKSLALAPGTNMALNALTDTVGDAEPDGPLPRALPDGLRRLELLVDVPVRAHLGADRVRLCPARDDQPGQPGPDEQRRPAGRRRRRSTARRAATRRR